MGIPGIDEAPDCGVDVGIPGMEEDPLEFMEPIPLEAALVLVPPRFVFIPAPIGFGLAWFAPIVGIIPVAGLGFVFIPIPIGFGFVPIGLVPIPIGLLAIGLEQHIGLVAIPGPIEGIFRGLLAKGEGFIPTPIIPGFVANPIPRFIPGLDAIGFVM